jgi:hypothetical protein
MALLVRQVGDRDPAQLASVAQVQLRTLHECQKAPASGKADNLKLFLHGAISEPESDLSSNKYCKNRIRRWLYLDDRFHETDHIGCHHSFLVNRHFAGTP